MPTNDYQLQDRRQLDAERWLGRVIADEPRQPGGKARHADLLLLLATTSASTRYRKGPLSRQPAGSQRQSGGADEHPATGSALSDMCFVVVIDIRTAHLSTALTWRTAPARCTESQMAPLLGVQLHAEVRVSPHDNTAAARSCLKGSISRLVGDKRSKVTER